MTLDRTTGMYTVHGVVYPPRPAQRRFLKVDGSTTKMAPKTKRFLRFRTALPDKFPTHPLGNGPFFCCGDSVSSFCKPAWGAGIVGRIRQVSSFRSTKKRIICHRKPLCFPPGGKFFFSNITAGDIYSGGERDRFFCFSTTHNPKMRTNSFSIGGK